MEITRPYNVIFTAVLICMYIGQDNCASINDTNVLLRNIMKNYNKNVRPVEYQLDTVQVNANLKIASIQELDEIRGILSVMGVLSMQWHDANMIWNPKDYGGVEYVITSYKDIWVPELILINAAEGRDTLGKKWQRVHFNHTGFASWWPGDLLRSTCSVDMYSYPFDTQECILTFQAWGYKGQVKIRSEHDQVDLSYYTEGSTWKLVRSETSTFKSRNVNFRIYLERKPGFVIVNVILPLTFLSLLNAFVFLLLPESGERISYCITVLLSIAVFMTIVSDNLPKSSEPVPVISYKLLFDMVISSLMTLVAILNLRLYNRKETDIVPNLLQSMYLFLSCKRSKSDTHPNENGRKSSKSENGITCFRRKEANPIQSGIMTDAQNSQKPANSLHNVEGVSCNSVEKRLVRLISEKDENVNEHIQVSWKDISNMVDGIAFIVFTLLSISSFVVFIAITYKH